MSHIQNTLGVCFLLVASSICFAENILANGSFEESDQLSAVSWKTGIWTGKAAFRTTQEGRGGSRCAKIISKQDGCDAAWRAEVSVESHTTYKLSGWIKTEGVEAGQGRGALLNVYGMEGVRTKALVGTTDWTYVEVCFNPVQRTQVTINCLLGGWGISRGTAWYDDVKLEVVSINTKRPIRSLVRKRVAICAKGIKDLVCVSQGGRVASGFSRSAPLLIFIIGSNIQPSVRFEQIGYIAASIVVVTRTKRRIIGRVTMLDRFRNVFIQ